jgi:outer membrane protein insertion porin family
MVVNVDKGEKIKIAEIDFIGNENYQIKLYATMKDTKQKTLSYTESIEIHKENTKPI